MDAQSQHRSNSAKVPQRWLAVNTDADQVRPGEEEEEDSRCCKECLKDKSNLILLGCGHRFCPGRLDEYVRPFLSLKRFPPRCCGQTISLYKHSDVLSHAVLSQYLRVRIKMAHEDNIPCAASACIGFEIPHYLVEDEWGLCEKCHQVTCGRCHRLLIHHQGDWKARICPTTIDPTATNSTSNKVAKKTEPRHCSKCHKFIPDSGGLKTIPCPCGAIVCGICFIHQKSEGLILSGCWCKRVVSKPSAINGTTSDVPDSAMAVQSKAAAQPTVNTSTQVRAELPVDAGLKGNHLNRLLQPVVLQPQQFLQPLSGPRQGPVNHHYCFGLLTLGQCAQCRGPNQAVMKCSTCMIMSCTMCLKSKVLRKNPELVDRHSFYEQIILGQCAQCRRPDQPVWTCMKCKMMSCQWCYASGCGLIAPGTSTLKRPRKMKEPANGVVLFSSPGVPTWDGVRYALQGRVNGLTRDQLLHLLSCRVALLNNMLEQMLNANLVWSLNTDDGTRYGLRQGPPVQPKDTSTMSVFPHGTLHQQSDRQPVGQVPQPAIVPQPATDQSAAAEKVPGPSPQAPAGPDAPADVCHDFSTQTEPSQLPSTAT